MGNIPGLPKVHLHSPVLAYEVGYDFMEYWFKAASGKLDPFVLVLEGSAEHPGLVLMKTRIGGTSDGLSGEQLPRIC
jgi:hypothetical protein